MLGAQTWVARSLGRRGLLRCGHGHHRGDHEASLPLVTLICFVLLSRPVHVEWCYNLLDLGAVPVSHFF